MNFVWCVMLGVLSVLASPGLADDPAAGLTRQGYGYILNNDFLGDGLDRWRSGSVTSSWIYGRDWGGQLPTTAGALLEFRLQGEVRQPQNLRVPATDDRSYAGQVSLGLHTHFQSQGYQVALGGDLNIVGPQTRLDALQGELHRTFSAGGPSAATRAAQIENQILGSLVVEVAKPISVTSHITLRPFIEARAGAETMLRGGADLTLGANAAGGMQVRDAVTGQRYHAIRAPHAGVSFLLGADFAHVTDSIYLPGDGGVQLEHNRNRLRMGLHWQGQDRSVFYGATWMGREFVGQGEQQVVGSVQLNFRF